MAVFIYHRCSTDSQQFAQQQKCVKDYMLRMGISDDMIEEVVTEKVSGTVKHTDRRLFGLLNKCQSGDTILVSELSRLGRNMTDLFEIVTKACEIGIRLIQCKDGSTIENSSIGGKALLFALSLAAEIEVANIRQRTQMGIDVIKEKLSRGESYVSKRSGRIITRLGREKGCDNTKAGIARGAQITAEAIEWRRNSEGYKAVRRWVREGRTQEFIISEFNAMHAACPEHFSTPTGKPLSVAIFKQWRAAINKEINV